MASRPADPENTEGWRKYGSKELRKATALTIRHYYRCSVPGCTAKKYFDCKAGEDPVSHSSKTTIMGIHEHSQFLSDINQEPSFAGMGGFNIGMCDLSTFPLPEHNIKTADLLPQSNAAWPLKPKLPSMFTKVAEATSAEHLLNRAEATNMVNECGPKKLRDADPAKFSRFASLVTTAVQQRGERGHEYSNDLMEPRDFACRTLLSGPIGACKPSLEHESLPSAGSGFTIRQELSCPVEARDRLGHIEDTIARLLQERDFIMGQSRPDAASSPLRLLKRARDSDYDSVNSAESGNSSDDGSSSDMAASIAARSAAYMAASVATRSSSDMAASIAGPSWDSQPTPPPLVKQEACGATSFCLPSYDERDSLPAKKRLKPPSSLVPSARAGFRAGPRRKIIQQHGASVLPYGHAMWSSPVLPGPTDLLGANPHPQ